MPHPGTALPVTTSASCCSELPDFNLEKGLSLDVCGDSPGCKGGDFELARDHCESLGARLCSLGEITAGETKGTGCLADQDLVWTSTQCVLTDDGTGTGSQAGFMAGLGSDGSDAACLPLSTHLKVRCCADDCRPSGNASFRLGERCSDATDCESGLCRDGICFGESCKPLKYTPGTPFYGNVLNMVLVGSHFNDHDTWKSAAEAKAASLAQFDQFGALNDQFNLFYVDELTDLGCAFNCGGVGRMMCCDFPGSIEVASRCAFTSDTLYVLAIFESEQYGGSGGPGFRYAAVTNGDGTDMLTLHELGHSMFMLADEYDYSGSDSRWSNCEDRPGCPAWADLIAHGGFPEVGCEEDPTATESGHRGCRDNEYMVAQRSVMNELSVRKMGEANNRLSCCTFFVYSGQFPAYCDRFEFSPGYLENWCRSNDYQGYGEAAYGVESLTRGLDSGKGAVLKVDNPRSVIVSVGGGGGAASVRGGGGPSAASFTARSTGPPGLASRKQVEGDFSSLEEARLAGREEVLVVEVNFASGPPTVLLMDAVEELEVPLPLHNDDNVDPGPSYITRPVDGLMLSLDDRREVASITVEIVPTSCSPRGAACGFDIQCCSGVCSGRFGAKMCK
jgi:hypothetical protein